MGLNRGFHAHSEIILREPCRAMLCIGLLLLVVVVVWFGGSCLQNTRMEVFGVWGGNMMWTYAAEIFGTVLKRSVLLFGGWVLPLILQHAACVRLIQFELDNHKQGCCDAR